VILVLAAAACSPGPVHLPAARQDTAATHASAVHIAAGRQLGWVDLAVDAMGVAHLSWADRADSPATLWVTRSSDGDSVDPPTQVAGSAELPPWLSVGRKPSLALGPGGELLLAVGSGDTRSSAITLYEQPTPSAEFSVTEIAHSGPWVQVDQPEVAVAPNGEIWMGYKVEPTDHVSELWWSRSSTGHQAAPLRAAPGQPCECCPHRFVFLSESVGLLYRNNELNLREIWSTWLPEGEQEFGSPSRVSNTGWWIPACPFDGPTSAQLDGELLVSWVDTTTGESRPWLARSSDGGQTWSRGSLLEPRSDDTELSPRLVQSGSTLWHATEAAWSHTVLRRSTDAGHTWERVPLPVLLLAPELATGGGRTLLAGVAENGIWLIDLDAL
jgi:hypothetical protein